MGGGVGFHPGNLSLDDMESDATLSSVETDGASPVDENFDANKALEAARQARASLIERMNKPSWYSSVYGLLMGAMIAAQALDQPWSLLVVAGSSLVLALIFRNWVRQSGMKVYGFTPRRARWVAFGLGAVLLPLGLAAVYFKFALQQWQPVLALAVLGAAAAYGGSKLWHKVYAAEVREAA